MDKFDLLKKIGSALDDIEIKIKEICHGDSEYSLDEIIKNFLDFSVFLYELGSELMENGYEDSDSLLIRIKDCEKMLNDFVIKYSDKDKLDDKVERGLELAAIKVKSICKEISEMYNDSNVLPYSASVLSNVLPYSASVLNKKDIMQCIEDVTGIITLLDDDDRAVEFRELLRELREVEKIVDRHLQN